MWRLGELRTDISELLYLLTLLLLLLLLLLECHGDAEVARSESLGYLTLLSVTKATII